MPTRKPGRPGRPAEFFLELHYTPDQIAIALGIHKKTVLDLIKTDQGLREGSIKPMGQVVRVPASVLNDYLRRTRIAQPA